MYNLWGFKLPPTVTASLWSSSLPWGRPSGSILILQWNCRPSLLLVLPSVLSSSIVPPLHRFLLSHSVHVLEPRAKGGKSCVNAFISYFFIASVFPWVCFSAFSWLSYFDRSPRQSCKPQIICLLCPVRLHCFIFTLFVFTHLTSCLTKHSTACL